MTFYGLQKLTLLDYPNKMASTLFTGGCNFRCPFCHNKDLVLNPTSIEAIDEEEILSFLKKRKGMLDGICITGGEPLLCSDLESFIYKAKELGYLVKLDTNGSFFDKLEKLVKEKAVDYVAMDIKNSFEKYDLTTGVKTDLDSVKKSIEFLKSGVVDYEFRTTVVKEYHEFLDFEKIAIFLAGSKQYYLQNFVDSGNTIKKNLHSLEVKDLEIIQKYLKNYIEIVQIRGI